MKLTFILMLVSILHVAGSVYSQNESLKFNTMDLTMRELFKEVENQSKFRFFYNDIYSNIDQKVILVKKEMKLNEVMEVVLSGTNLSYKLLENNLIVISPKIILQQQTVKGTVKDAKSGQGLPGVNIKIQGTSEGTITDLDGNFSLKVHSSTATLIFSFIGYIPQTISLDGKTSLEIKLEEEVRSLDEVVVIGYGTARRSELTGAVSSVNSKTIQNIPVNSAAEALTGRMAGVQITTTDGSPDASILIRVRGGGSVTQDNSPLYIVDGFPVSNISDIAPTDIATIDVLKDASTSAIYGARGANGVIIITTKSASAGKTVISYNGYMQARTLPKKLDVLSPYEFVLAQYEYAKLRGGTDLTNFTKYFGVYDDLELYKSQKGTDWQDKLFGSTAWSKNNNLSISGGSDQTMYNLSLTNTNDQGILVGSGYNRSNINFKLNHKISKNLKVEFNTRFSNTDVDGAGTAGTASLKISDGITTRPVNGLLDVMDISTEDAAANYDQFVRSLINPIDLQAQDYRKRVTKAFNTSGAISWTIIPNLTFRSEMGVDFGFQNDKRYYGPLTSESKNNGGNLPLGEITQTETQKYRMANTLTYTLKLKDLHSFNLMLGQEIISGKSKNEYNRSKTFALSIEPEKMFANMALGTVDRHSTYVYPDDNLSSFFGRLNYSLSDRYLITATLRADGSSKFAPGNQWGLFPAGAIAWRASEENFVKQMDFVSNLKFRASIGQAGNDRIPLDLWHRTYKISDVKTIGFGDAIQPYYIPSSTILVNPDLKWEVTTTRNAGLDYGIFKERINGSVDLYWNTTKDLLVQSVIPSYTGYTAQMRNIGQTSNRGIEFTVNANIIEQKDFKLQASFNIGFNKSKIDKLDGGDVQSFQSGWASTDLATADDYRLMVGNTVGLMYGYVSDGFYTVDDFSSYNPVSKKYIAKPGVANDEGLLGGLSLRPGLMKLKNLGGDSTINANDDRMIIGNANPKHSGGFNINATYKGFDLAMMFNWVYGNDIYNTGKISNNMLYRTTYGNMLNTMNSSNRFKYIDNTGEVVTDLEALRTLNTSANIWTPFSSGTARPVMQSWAIEDGSFLRLSNVTLGYSLPKSIIQRVKMQTFRIYFTVNNAWLWTKYTGYDPEVSTTRSSSYSALTPGVDYSAYPKSRSYTLGLNITF